MNISIVKSVEDEKLLVAKAAKGDKQAFNELVLKYQSKAQGIAYSIVRNTEDAEDVVQEAFVKAFFALPKFKGESKFYTWFYRIVYNMGIDYKRKLARLPKKKEGIEVLSREAKTNSTPEKDLISKQDTKLVDKFIDSLTEEHRSVLLLREIQGLSYDEIAESMGVSKGTVMSRLFYARKKLQESYDSFFTSSDDKAFANKKLGVK